MKEWTKYLGYSCQFAGFAFCVPFCDYSIEVGKGIAKMASFYYGLTVIGLVAGASLLVIGYIILKRKIEL